MLRTFSSYENLYFGHFADSGTIWMDQQRDRRRQRVDVGQQRQQQQEANRGPNGAARLFHEKITTFYFCQGMLNRRDVPKKTYPSFALCMGRRDDHMIGGPKFPNNCVFEKQSGNAVFNVHNPPPAPVDAPPPPPPLQQVHGVQLVVHLHVDPESLQKVALKN